MDGNTTTTFTADERVKRHIHGLYSQLRDAVENGVVIPKALYQAPGISSSTVARMMNTDDVPPADMQFSTVFNLVDRVPLEIRIAMLAPVMRDLGLQVLPVRAIDPDVNGDGTIDEKDARAAALDVNELITRLVNQSIEAVEDGKVTENERAAAQRVRTELQQNVDRLVLAIEHMAMAELRRRTPKRRMPLGIAK